VTQGGQLSLRLVEIDLTNEEARYPSKCTSPALENSPKVKLIPADSLPPDTKYLTLSHFWGAGPVLRLFNGNLGQYLAAIPRHILDSPGAATFRHAIHITRALSFRYLWIDALCINQEDPAENNSELMRMDQIYSHGSLNISATVARDGSGGLFFDRDPLLVGSCQSETCPNLLAYIPAGYSFGEEMLQGPVNLRAWVLQEPQLSTRILHFCRSRIFWKCLQTQEAEPAIDQDPFSLAVVPRQTKNQLIPDSENGFSLQHTQYLWEDLVES
jgi:hypothetical protein